MKLVVFTSSFHIGASVTLRRILQSSEFEVAGIVHHQVIAPNVKSVRKVRRMIKKAGVRFLLKTAFVNALQRVALFSAKWLKDRRKRKLFSVDELAQNHGIPLLITDNVNSEEALAFVRAKEPDLLVSCYLLQLVKKAMLDIPRQGAVNVHPALLPQFAGSWTNFWVLFYRQTKAGVTVHFMNEEFDSGDIILQKKFRVKGVRSLQCFTQKTAHFSAKVLVDALRKLKRKQFEPRRMPRPRKLFSLPGKKEIADSRKIFPYFRFSNFLQWF